MKYLAPIRAQVCSNLREVATQLAGGPADPSARHGKAWRRILPRALGVNMLRFRRLGLVLTEQHQQAEALRHQDTLTEFGRRREPERRQARGASRCPVTVEANNTRQWSQQQEFISTFQQRACSPISSDRSLKRVRWSRMVNLHL
jgi:hypothetical protein